MFWTLNLPAASPLGLSRIDLRSGVVAECGLGSAGHPVEIVAAVSRREDDAWPGFRRDERMPGHRRAVHEVPGPQVPFLVFDDERALAHQDEEVLLDRLCVVESHWLSRRHDADREPGVRLDVLGQIGSALQHDAVGLEDADAAIALVVGPDGVSSVDDEPSRRDWCQPRCETFKACFSDHSFLLVVDLVVSRRCTPPTTGGCQQHGRSGINYAGNATARV